MKEPLPSAPVRQHNRRNLSSSCLEATCQTLATLITQLVTVITCLSAMSDISQDGVTTPMRCGGIFSVSVSTYFLLILTVKKIWKSVNIWCSYWHIKILCHFLANPVVVHCDQWTLCAAVTAGGNPYPGMEMDETFITRLKNGYRMSKPKLAPDSMYVPVAVI